MSGTCARCLPRTPITTTHGGRIGHCGCARRARHRRFPSRSMAGSGADRSWAGSSTSMRWQPETAGQEPWPRSGTREVPNRAPRVRGRPERPHQLIYSASRRAGPLSVGSAVLGDDRSTVRIPLDLPRIRSGFACHGHRVWVLRRRSGSRDRRSRRPSVAIGRESLRARRAHPSERSRRSWTRRLPGPLAVGCRRPSVAVGGRRDPVCRHHAQSRDSGDAYRGIGRRSPPLRHPSGVRARQQPHRRPNRPSESGSRVRGHVKIRHVHASTP